MTAEDERSIRCAGCTSARPGSAAPRCCGSLTADGYLVLDLVASYALGPWRFGVTVDNLLDGAWREAQFAETSRLPGEAAPVEDVHFTPGTPLVALVTVGFVLR